MVFQNTSPLLAARMKQSPDTAENGRKRAAASLKVLDERIGDKPFVAGDRPTIADCTLLAALDFGAFIGMPLDAQLTNVARWYQAFKQRPSAQA
jgi:glutathione S-transferase